MTKKIGRIYNFIDFGNVNYWYERDRKDFDGKILERDQKLIVNIEKLSQFIDLFSDHKRFYYGLDLRKKSTWHITKLAKRNDFVVIKKPIQWIKHYLGASDKNENIDLNHKIKKDKRGIFIEVPKCNFDVELAIGAVRLINHYDTIALFSGDSDFAMLLKFLRNHNKKVILFYAGHISHWIKKYTDLLINAQEVKSSICAIKTKKKNPV